MRKVWKDSGDPGGLSPHPQASTNHAHVGCGLLEIIEECLDLMVKFWRFLAHFFDLVDRMNDRRVMLAAEAAADFG